MYAIWLDNGTQFPKEGSLGRVCKANGHDDEDSAEYKAWLFFPDKPLEGERNLGYYGEMDVHFRIAKGNEVR